MLHTTSFSAFWWAQPSAAHLSAHTSRSPPSPLASCRHRLIYAHHPVDLKQLARPQLLRFQTVQPRRCQHLQVCQRPAVHSRDIHSKTLVPPLAFPNIPMCTFQRDPGDPGELGGLPALVPVTWYSTWLPNLACPSSCSSCPSPLSRANSTPHPTLEPLQGSLGRQGGLLGYDWKQPLHCYCSPPCLSLVPKEGAPTGDASQPLAQGPIQSSCLVKPVSDEACQLASTSPLPVPTLPTSAPPPHPPLPLPTVPLPVLRPGPWPHEC